MSKGKKQNESHKLPTASLLEEQDPNTRTYFNHYASPEMRSELRRLQFESANAKLGPEAQMAAPRPFAEVGIHTYAPMGSSYPVSLHSLLDADPAARAYLASQPQEIQQAVMATNLQAAGELEKFVKKLENRLDGRDSQSGSESNPT